MTFYLWITVARAAGPECAGFDSTALAAVIDRAQVAVFDGDLTQVDTIDTELGTKVPCLTEPAEPATWANYLVTRSIVAYNRKDDWQTPLQSALQADPSVNRQVGQSHPIGSWTAPAPAASREAGADVLVYVDGRRVRFLPALWGPHLVQLSRGGVVRSVYLPAGQGDGEWVALLQPPVGEEAADPASQPEAPKARKEKPELTVKSEALGPVAPVPVPRAVKKAASKAASAALPKEPPKPAARPAKQVTVGWLVTSGGLAATTVGTIWGFSTWSDGTVYTRPEWAALQASNAVGWTIAGLGGAATGVGIAWLVHRPRVSLAVGPGSVSVQVPL